MSRTDAVLLAMRRVIESHRAYIDAHGVREINLTIKLTAQGEPAGALLRPLVEYEARALGDVARYQFQAHSTDLTVAHSERDGFAPLG